MTVCASLNVSWSELHFFNENYKNNTNKDRYKQNEKMGKRCRPNICTTQKYIQNQNSVPGNRTYPSATKYEKLSWLTETVISKELSGT